MATYYRDGVSRRKWNLERDYRDMLDDCYGMVRIGLLEYVPSTVLREVDPLAYRCGFLDYLDSEGWREAEELSGEEKSAVAA